MPKKIEDAKKTEEELEDELDEEELEEDDSTDDEDDDSDENEDDDPLMKLSKSELIYRVQKGERDTAKANRQAAKRRIDLRDLQATIKKTESDEDEDDSDNEALTLAQAENQKLKTKILKLDASTQIGKTEITVEGKKYQIIDSEDILIESEDDLDDVEGMLEDAFRLKPHFFELVDPAKKKKEKSPGSPKGKNKRKKENKKPIKFGRHHL